MARRYDERQYNPLQLHHYQLNDQLQQDIRGFRAQPVAGYIDRQHIRQEHRTDGNALHHTWLLFLQQRRQGRPQKPLPEITQAPCRRLR